MSNVTDTWIHELVAGLEDPEILASIKAEVHSHNRPEDLIERILFECKEYERSGVRGQYAGTYRGHKFFIGWETQINDNISMQEMYIRMQSGSRKASKRIMVFCIAGKVGGYATEGLRYTGEFEGKLREALIALFNSAESKYEAAEIQRLMSADPEATPLAN